MTFSRGAETDRSGSLSHLGALPPLTSRNDQFVPKAESIPKGAPDLEPTKNTVSGSCAMWNTLTDDTLVTLNTACKRGFAESPACTGRHDPSAELSESGAAKEPREIPSRKLILPISTRRKLRVASATERPEARVRRNGRVGVVSDPSMRAEMESSAHRGPHSKGVHPGRNGGNPVLVDNRD